MPEGEKKTPSFSLTLPVAIVFAAIIIAGAILVTHGQAPTAADAAGGNIGAGSASISVRPAQATDHILGSATAKVFIIEYSDFECPYC